MKSSELRESLRLSAVQSPVIPIVAGLIREHPGTISLGQGVVYYGPPPEAIDQISCFLAQPDNHKYKPVHGLPTLLDSLARKLRGENRIPLGAENRLLVTAGGNMAFMNAVLAVADPGDEFILQRPYYFNHEMAVTIAGCKPVLVDTDPAYQLQPDAIEAAITPRTKAVVTISPNNPTGAVYPEAALRRVNAICREHGVYHIHDEAYEYFVYEARTPGAAAAAHFSPGSIGDSERHTISLFSLSKAFGFASWRIGYMVAPEHLFSAIQKIQDTILICAPVISQFAAIGALQAGRAYCEEKLRPIREIREVVLNELAALGDVCAVPEADGAFYVLLRLDTDRPAMNIVEQLIRDHRVAAIPGTAFGLDDGCYLRIAYGALEKQTATEGISRLVKGLKAILAR